MPSQTSEASQRPELRDQLLRERLAALTEEEEGHSFPDPGRYQEEVAHGLFQYPAMMVPGVQRIITDLLLQVDPSIQHVIDPFIGAGTALATVMHHGVSGFGQDINPLAVLMSRVRLEVHSPHELPEQIERVLRYAREDSSQTIEAGFPNLAKWFNPEVAEELSRIRRAIRRIESLWVRRLCWVSLAETVRLTSNDRTSTYKLHARPQEEVETRSISPIKIFEETIEENLHQVLAFWESLRSAGQVTDGRYRGEMKVALSNTTRCIDASEGRTFDLLVTSPPYGDNTSTVPYGQHSYLPLQWIDMEDIDETATSDILRTTQEIDRRSIGGRTVRVDEMDLEMRSLGEESLALKETLKALEDRPRDRAARVVAFCRDLIPAVDRIVPVLREDAYLVWTIGNRTVGGVTIPNHQILADILGSRGVEVVTKVERDIRFKRMAHRNQITSTMQRERILIFRKSSMDRG